MKKLIAILALLTTVSGFADDLVTLSIEDGKNLQFQVKNAIQNGSLRCTLVGNSRSDEASDELGKKTKPKAVNFLSGYIDEHTLSRPDKNKQGYIEFTTIGPSKTKEENGVTVFYKDHRILKLFLKNERFSFDTFRLIAKSIEYSEGVTTDIIQKETECTIVM